MAKINITVKKKGIFFTFISLAIIGILILIYTPQADITVQKDTKAMNSRISHIDNYVNELENVYMINIIEATAQKTLLSLVLYVKSTKAPVVDFDSAFAEIMLNGTINGVPIDSITEKKIMDNHTVTNWTARLVQAGQDTFNTNTSITLQAVKLNQSVPWDVDVTLVMSYSIKSNVAEWKRDNVTVGASVNIEEFEDPLYFINTNGVYSNKIKRSGLEFNQWNITFVREHVQNGTYVHWQDSQAPNFIMRFSNITSNSSCCGIESLVNPIMVSPSDQGGSYVDYLFWNQTYNSQCTQVYNVTNPATGNIGLWDEFKFFKLDVDHITKYNVTPEYATRSC
ncbi:MAG TPA: hypothetical protein VJJ52_01750 [Candidatus Nanoarchaeia archaeon]|nr:hypothetical protein [Candidatus Nanoarchaeia archaeon]